MESLPPLPLLLLPSLVLVEFEGAAWLLLLGFDMVIIYDLKVDIR